jgi:NAD(P)H-dependent FMN reductase
VTVNESADEGLGGFSAELTREVGKALGALLTSPGDETQERLRQATRRVCTEAHQMALPPEQMVIALKRLFDRVPLAGAIDPDRRRAAYEQFVAGCIAAYYDADDVEQS